MKIVACAVAALLAAVAAVPAEAQPNRPARLVPPTAAECAALRRAVQPAIPRPLARGAGPVEFFSGEWRVEGRGCTLQARGNGTQFDRMPDWGRRLEAAVQRAGWRRDEGMQADGAGSQVIGFRRGDLYLYLSTEDFDGGPCSGEAGERPGVDCEQTRARSQVSVDLGLARGAR